MSKTADELLDLAWGVIANAGWDGLDKTEGWQDAAIRWRDEYHGYLDESPSVRMELTDEDVRGAFHAADVLVVLAHNWLAHNEQIPDSTRVNLHMCRRHGFDPMQGDVCPPCQPVPVESPEVPT